MMHKQRIQLSGSGVYIYKIALQIHDKGRNILLRFRYNNRGRYWAVTIIDPLVNKEIISNIPLVSINQGDMQWSFIRPIQHKGIGYAYLVPKRQDSDYTTPDLDKLFNDFYLDWVSE